MKETSSTKRTSTRNGNRSAAKTKSSTSARKKTKAKASGKRAGSRTVSKAVDEKRKYFYQELIGLAFLGLGIFSFISMVSGSVGILGESIKEILIAILGMMAYIFPFIFMLMGTALIIRRPWIFSNKKTYGALLVVLVTAMLLSLNRMEAVHREGFMVTLKNLMNINDVQHGGILGLSMAVPLYRLLGPLGTYIIAGCFYVVAFILIFNTTIYDMLRKSNQARLEAKGKIAVKIEEAQAHKELKKDNPEERKIQDKLKILEMMNQSEEEPVGSEKVETQSPFINLDLEENDGLERVLSKEDDLSREIQILGKNAEAPAPEPEKAARKNGHNNDIDQKTRKAEERPQITEEKRKGDHDDSYEIEGSQIGLDDLEKPLYEFPEIALLKQNIKGMLANEDRNEIIENAKKLEETLMSFGVEARVINVSKGPSVTRYELQPKAGVKVSRIVNLSDDIALALAARGVRIEAPIPGKAAVGIEIPNKETTPVYLREVIEDAKFQKSTKKISVALGKDISGEAIIGDLSKMPHVLIAGATGSGKSVCINSLIISILYKYDPEHVRLLMVDPKVVELNVYNGIPHLLIPVVTDPKKAAGALNWAVNEMTRRYQSFAEHGVRNIEGFNEIAKKKKDLQSLPYIVIIVDELADLMMVSANEVEDYIARLAQMARAAGMHLVIATQRPSVDVITGVIKANIPSRISFAVSSAIDSRTILDSGGAEKLLGKGDMLYYPVGEQKPKRIQGAFISEEEVEAIVSRIKVHQDKLAYDEEIINHIEKGKGDSDLGDDGDELYRDAVKVVVENQQASTSFLQRKMRIGYNRAARIMDELEDRGVISERDGSKPRQVLLNEFDLEE